MKPNIVDVDIQQASIIFCGVIRAKKNVPMMNMNPETGMQYKVPNSENTRNGDTRMSFFRAAFERMEIHEMDTPPQQQRR